MGEYGDKFSKYRGGETGTASTAIAIPKLKQVGLRQLTVQLYP
jgi:hypothetical protein